jgi:hypothetical protein
MTTSEVPVRPYFRASRADLIAMRKERIRQESPIVEVVRIDYGTYHHKKS